MGPRRGNLPDEGPESKPRNPAKSGVAHRGTVSITRELILPTWVDNVRFVTWTSGKQFESPSGSMPAADAAMGK